MSNRKLLKLVFHGHRHIGLFCALFIVVSAVSGTLLNHTTALELDQRYTSSAAVLKWYGIQAPQLGDSFTVGGHWFVELEQRLYFNGNLVTDTEGPLLGVVSHAMGYLAAYPNELLLIDKQGLLIERMTTDLTLPSSSPIEAIGLMTDERPFVMTTTAAYVGDEMLLDWHPFEQTETFSPSAAQLPEAIRLQLLTQYQGRGLTLERLLLDIHSGRIGGDVGVWFMDLVALMMILLAVSGFYSRMAISKRLKTGAKRKNHPIG